MTWQCTLQQEQGISDCSNALSFCTHSRRREGLQQLASEQRWSVPHLKVPQLWQALEYGIQLGRLQHNKGHSCACLMMLQMCYWRNTDVADALRTVWLRAAVLTVVWVQPLLDDALELEATNMTAPGNQAVQQWTAS
jgi:hypothetical protein